MSETKKGPGESEGDGTARHGYRNEVSWDEGKGRQPYANRGEVEEQADAIPEAEAGNMGETAGRNLEDLEAVKGTPGQGRREAPRGT